jgi:hypothetical protein
MTRFFGLLRYFLELFFFLLVNFSLVLSKPDEKEYVLILIPLLKLKTEGMILLKDFFLLL